MIPSRESALICPVAERLGSAVSLKHLEARFDPGQAPLQMEVGDIHGAASLNIERNRCYNNQPGRMLYRK